MQKFLFDNRVRLLMTNQKMGDFHPLSVNFMDRLNPVLERLDVNSCLSPVSDSTNKVFVDAETTLERFTRTSYFADAAITKSRRRALMITTADCFVGVVLDPEKMGLALVRLGLKNIYREDGSPSTLENVVKIMRGRTNDKNLLFWFGCGIGNCCYGISDSIFIKKLKNKFGNLSVFGEVEKGPRRGYPAIDLHNIINDEAIRLGLEVCNDRESDHCNSCYPYPGHFFSNVRDSETNSGKLKPKNGVFAMMR